jgi:hypothetical protein
VLVKKAVQSLPKFETPALGSQKKPERKALAGFPGKAVGQMTICSF